LPGPPSIPIRTEGAAALSASNVNFGALGVSIRRSRLAAAVAMIRDRDDIASALRRRRYDGLDRMRTVGKLRVGVEVRAQPSTLAVPAHRGHELRTGLHRGDGRCCDGCHEQFQ